MKELPERMDRSVKIYSALLMMIFASLSLPALAAPKTDVIVFKNGDKLTGEIKSMQRGRLSFNTDATGTISIEWAEIRHIESLQNIQVETSAGTRFFGHLEPTEEEDVVVVNTGNGLQTIDPAKVILMSPIEDRGIGAFDIDLTVGYNFAKAGGVTQGSFGVDVDYRTRVRIYSISGSTTVNDSEEQEASKRANFGLQYKRLWQNRWFVSGNLNMEQNDEQDLDLRTSIGGGGGRFLIQSNSMILGVQAGLQFSRENLARRDPILPIPPELLPDPEDVDSVEAVFSVDWDWFRFDNPELDWSTTAEVIPSLTESGRVRANFDTSLKWELINDLKWGVTFYSSFDSESQSDSGSTSDYGVNTTLTYEF